MRGAPASAGAARPARGSVGTRAGLRSVGAAAEPLFVGTPSALVSGVTLASRPGLHARAGLLARRRARLCDLAVVCCEWCVARQVAAAGDEGEAAGDEGDEGEAAEMRGVLCAAVGIMASPLPAWK